MTVSAIPTEDVATTIHYEITQQDLEAFQWYYFHHSPHYVNSSAIHESL